MSRRSGVSGVGRMLAGGVSACMLLASSAGAATPPPLSMGPLYAEPDRPSDAPAPPTAGGCPVRIELTDARRAPEMVGALMTFRTLAAPADREAWLRSVFQVGLTARGFQPSFAVGADGAAPGGLVARVRIRTIWVALLQMNKTGSVAMQVSAGRPGGPLGPEKTYRGDQTSVNMMGSQSEFNGLVNKVFAEALDAMAADLQPLCSAGGPATPA